MVSARWLVCSAVLDQLRRRDLLRLPGRVGRVDREGVGMAENLPFDLLE